MNKPKFSGSGEEMFDTATEIIGFLMACKPSEGCGGQCCSLRRHKYIRCLDHRERLLKEMLAGNPEVFETEENDKNPSL